MAATIGIDAGNAYTKVVELEPKQNKITNAFLFKTPYLSSLETNPQAVASSSVDAQAFWREINKHIPPARLKDASLAIAVPAETLTTVYLLLPRMPQNELAQAAITEAKRIMIPASTDNHTFEWILLGNRIAEKTPKSEVLVIRAEKPRIQHLMELFSTTTPAPELISPLSCCLTAILPKEVWSKNEDIALVDLGTRGLNISIYSQEKPVLSRNAAYDFQDFTQYFSAGLGFDRDTTEKILLEYGIPQIDYDPGNKLAVAEEIMRQKYEMSLAPASPGKTPKLIPLELRTLWQSYIEKIIHELRRSLTYYKDQSAGRRVEQIYFLGGVSQIKNLEALFSASIGGRCRVIDTIAAGPIFTGAASLALRLLSKDKKHAQVNFLPPELKQHKRETTRKLTLYITGLGLLAVSGLLLTHTLVNNYLLSQKILMTQNRLNNIEQTAESRLDQRQRENLLRQRSAQIEELIKKRADFYSPLKALTAITPPGMLLLKISIAKNASSENSSSSMPAAIAGMPSSKEQYQIHLQAQIYADYENASRLLETFKRSLESIRYFKNITITPLVLEDIDFDAGADMNDAPLTKTISREFTLTAEIALQ